MTNGFQPLSAFDGYLPIADHGLIGDVRSAALVGRDGTVSWLCAPRFDSPPVFCSLLDRERGGSFRIDPVGLRETRQHYHADTGVLVTELRTGTGVLEVTDALTLNEGVDLAERLRAGRGELLRQLRVTHGEVTVELAVEPRGEVSVSRSGDGWRLRSAQWPDLILHFAVSIPVDGLRSTLRLNAGDQVYAQLSWAEDAERARWPGPERRMRSTITDWQRWARCLDYNGPQTRLVRRSAVTLKLLDHDAGGAIVAAPTSSLPEAIGGERNWDYRFSWIRDAAFSVYAMRRVGLVSEATNFLHWVLDAIERKGEARVLYDLDGHAPPAERTDPDLAGYRGSHPVRWGNGAADQVQHDVYGEILDCAHQRAAGGGRIDPALWTWLGELVDRARQRWHTPDHGIWEVRTSGRLFTYSVAMCQVALNRASRLARRFDLPGDPDGWAKEADRIRDTLLSEAWDPSRHTLVEHLAPDEDRATIGLDAALLALPPRRVVPSTHPKMVATTAAIAERLDAGDGLLFRYLPDESPDGLSGEEGAFLLCSFWLVDNLAKQGRWDEAGQLYESLCARANPLGLLPEQIDPDTGAFLGNFPQAFSHVGVISSGLNLTRGEPDGGGES
jgi:alpha,alpha-trehalase